MPATSGTVSLTSSDGCSLYAEKGDLLYIPKGCVYKISFQNHGEELRLYTVNFCLTDRNGRKVRMSDVPQLFPSVVSEECRYLAEALSSVYVRHSDNRMKQQAYFFSLLDRLLDSVSAERENDDGVGIGLRMLTEEWNRNTNISAYAKICAMSESEFYRAFYARTGMSPHAYRMQMRMTAAKALLTDSSLTVERIAKEVGYDDPYYFSRVFRNKSGFSPRQYRRQTKK